MKTTEEKEGVVLEEYRSLFEAQIAHDILKDAGIDSYIYDTNMNNMYGGAVLNSRLVVKSSDVEFSREILAAKFVKEKE